MAWAGEHVALNQTAGAASSCGRRSASPGSCCSSAAGVAAAGSGLGVVAGAALIIILPLLVWHLDRAADDSQAVVLVPVLEVRSGPAERYTPVFTVHEGLKVRIRQTARAGTRFRCQRSGRLGAADTVERL